MTTTEALIRKIEVGTILSSSWGYDQTNIDFYLVVRMTPSGKSCYIRRIGAKTVAGSEGYMSSSIVPDPSQLHGDETRHVIKGGYNGSQCIKVRDFAWAYPTNPDTEHFNSWWH